MPTPAFEGRRIVLGVCGGIAAYKAVEVCRKLADAGAYVTPVLTRAATRFVGEVTFNALASEPVRTSLWDGPEPIPHTRMGRSADVIVVVPATARLIGEYAAGISSDLLTATLLATRAPVVLCPAMHTEMWEHPAVADNVALLRRRGVHVVGPDRGRLAGGDVGAGRLVDPDTIVGAVHAVLAGEAVPVIAVASASAAGPAQEERLAGGESDAAARAWVGVRVLVTAGGTREPIDAVRYVGNRSSGKQGHAIADVLAGRGATVTLVTTVGLPVAPGVEVLSVETAAEMERVVAERAGGAEVIVMAAAVADFRPKSVVGTKLKKADGVPDLVLEPTPDILTGLARTRRPGQVLVGFAAETVAPTAGERDLLIDAARSKLAAKGVDVVVANDVAAAHTGFGHETNAVVIVAADGAVVDVGLRPKQAVAVAVVEAVEGYRRAAIATAVSAPPEPPEEGP